MRLLILFFVIILSVSVHAQEERDTTLSRCPVWITDTATSNNFFIEARPAKLKVDRVRGDLTITIEQKDQFFTIFFRDKRLKNGKYKIELNPGGHGVAAKYSFRSGDQVSYVNVANGNLEATWDKEKNFWKIKVNGMIANLVERSITYYKVRADFNIR